MPAETCRFLAHASWPRGTLAAVEGLFAANLCPGSSQIPHGVLAGRPWNCTSPTPSRRARMSLTLQRLCSLRDTGFVTRTIRRGKREMASNMLGVAFPELAHRAAVRLPANRGPKRPELGFCVSILCRTFQGRFPMRKVTVDSLSLAVSGRLDCSL